MKINIHRLPVYLLVLLLIGSVSCKKTFTAGPSDNELLEGPIEELTATEKLEFIKGDEAFGEVFTAETGLGPLFVANQCASCHAGDGKGNPFVQFIRFGQSDTAGNSMVNLGGPQLQNNAIPGYAAEQLPSNATYTTLIAPAVTGLGYLDAVSDADLLSMEDPFDTDGDGISGRAHWNNVPDYAKLRPNSISNNGRYISRFGKKGAAYDLLVQTANAYNQDMGISSELESIDTYTGLHTDPEINIATIRSVVIYLKGLRAPVQRNQEDPNVKHGGQIFETIGCAKCHVSTLKTGESNIAALSNKVFHPYTDLLLHDMGPELDDKYTEGFASTSEWKTPALWGLGLSADSQGQQVYLLHDGRATSIEDAILLHAGEGLKSKTNYTTLSESDKSQLLEFLNSL